MPYSDQRRHQAQAFLELTHIIKIQKIPNAFLFYGNENTGRKNAALFLAKGCNCLKKNSISCNTCKSCHKIDAKSHPDIIIIDLEKDKRIISISQIRKMGLTIASRPNEARFRMVLISNADKMNTQAQNALLKMLEEPPEKTFFILIAKDISSLLPTINSRCRKIRFKPLNHKLIEQTLISDFKVDRQFAYIISRTVDSDIKKAMMYLNLDEKPNGQPNNSTAKKTADKTNKIDWIKKREYLLNTLADIIKTDTSKSILKGLMLSQKISLEPGILDDTIVIMKTFFRDLLIFQYDQKKIVNIDFFKTFNDIGQIVKSNIFFDWLENLFETQKRISSNSSPRIVLDRFFLKIAQQDDTKCCFFNC